MHTFRNKIINRERQPCYRDKSVIQSKRRTMDNLVQRPNYKRLVSTKHCQTWHGNYLRHGRANYIDLDQGHAYLNHENNTCSMISETATPITFAVNVVRLKVNIIFYQSDFISAAVCSSVGQTRRGARSWPGELITNVGG